ncbi:serine/threonine-protein phosphatase [Pseudonocardia sp. RS11V-5]|uniref:PP2C family protein-serine/threonine phosphatase n=1 Tax=Pseudonocardia terrae TaxID=2905831 RepID=UPI001E5687D9|nr:PP2C family protein-serine/threonine phosphatase [Pseudonocardia terrae]MCE3551687.1 serine/threonine-protein phosphatase [Pseudonocardia terrae]
MAGRHASRLAVRDLLEAVEAAAPADAVEEVSNQLAELFGASRVAFLIADLSGRAVVRLTRGPGEGEGGDGPGPDGSERIPLESTVYDRVLQFQEPVVEHEEAAAGEVRVVVPVTDRGDAIGVLEMTLPNRPGAEVLAELAAAGHALAFIVIANRRFTDLYAWGQRTTPLSVPAEIQHRLLPDAYTCEASQFTLAGWLEPSARMAGDTFDYVLDRDSVQLSMTDAVGHGLEAAMLATLAVNSLRNSRRTGRTLAQQADDVNRDLVRHTGTGELVTGQIARIDLIAERAGIVNAGHPRPLRVRDGLVEEVELAVDIPFGIDPEWRYRVQELVLEPGDRIVFLTDGMLERDAAHLPLIDMLLKTRSAHPREVVQALGAALLDATDGDLRDDATVMCLDWYGGPPRRRRSRGGADESTGSGSVVG